MAAPSNIQVAAVRGDAAAAAAIAERIEAALAAAAIQPLSERRRAYVTAAAYRSGRDIIWVEVTHAFCCADGSESPTYGGHVPLALPRTAPAILHVASCVRNVLETAGYVPAEETKV